MITTYKKAFYKEPKHIKQTKAQAEKLEKQTLTKFRQDSPEKKSRQVVNIEENKNMLRRLSAQIMDDSQLRLFEIL